MTNTSGDHDKGPPDQRLERYVALGLTVFIVVFCAAVIWRDKPLESGQTATYMRILLAVACGVLGGTIPGFLNVRYDIGGLAIRAAGGLAFAAMTYVYTPTVLPNMRTPEERALDRGRSGDIGLLFKSVNSYWDLPTNAQRYKDTKREERKALLTEWIGNDSSKNDALLEVPKFLADLHACIQNRRCQPTQLCKSSLFDDADNFLIFFHPLLADWANSGYKQTLEKAHAFIECDCYKELNAKRCPDHPSMCSAPPKCEGRAT